jgi:malonyl-CoA O-methyltransferase
MRIKEQFEKSAISYEEYSIVQNLGALALINEIKEPINSIIDLGCGSGRVYKELKRKNIKFNRFYGIDFAKSMINLHPKESNIELIVGDFNKKELFERLQKLNANTLISASALQWAKDLDFTFKECAKSAKMGYFFIFSSNTFKTIHKTINIKSPIWDKIDIINAFQKSFKPQKIEIINKNLEFNSTLDMLKYIKKSGVSGGLNLPYKKMKYLIENYPLNYLEFETVLLVGKSRELVDSD